MNTKPLLQKSKKKRLTSNLIEFFDLKIISFSTLSRLNKKVQKIEQNPTNYNLEAKFIMNVKTLITKTSCKLEELTLSHEKIQK